MHMVEVQAGLGLGVKKFRLIWVFENGRRPERLRQQGLGTRRPDHRRGQGRRQGRGIRRRDVDQPGVWLYQITDDGLALELTAKGTKYYKDSDLN